MDTARNHILDSIPVLAWRWDAQVGCSFVNAPWADYSGRTAIQLQQRGWLDVVHPLDQATVLEAFADAGRREREIVCRCRLIGRDGIARWFDTRGRPTRKADGDLQWTLASIDVQVEHERQVAERAEWAHLSRMIDAAPAVLCAFESRPDGSVRFPYANPRIFDIYGLTPEELREDGSRVFRMMHPDDVDAVNAAIADSARTSTTWRQEFRIRREDGRERWVEGWSVPSPLVDGSIMWYGFIADVTDRKLAEQRAQIWQRVFAQAGIGIVLGDVTQGTFVDVNRAYAALRGYEPDEIVGAPIASAYGEGWANILPKLRAADRDGHVVFEAEHRCKDGSRLPVLVDLTIIFDENRRPTSRVAFVSDLRPRRAVENALRDSEEQLLEVNAGLERRVAQRTAELQATNHALDAFAYSVSHDLRAPLRGIDGWSQALLEDCGAQLDDVGRQHLERVRTETQRMSGLIDSLLRLARVSRASLAIDAIDLTALANRVIDRLRDTLPPDRQVDVKIAPGLVVQADAPLLDVVMTNLLENALKFTRHRAPAVVEIGRDASCPHGFFVRDNGVGFDMAYADALFGPFKRLHRAADFPGSGIGLATVQRIVQRHSGRISATAQPGVGATLVVDLEPAS